MAYNGPFTQTGWTDTKSFAVNGEPSDHLELRKVKVQVLPSFETLVLVAKAFSTLLSLP